MKIHNIIIVAVDELSMNVQLWFVSMDTGAWPWYNVYSSHTLESVILYHHHSIRRRHTTVIGSAFDLLACHLVKKYNLWTIGHDSKYMLIVKY